MKGWFSHQVLLSKKMNTENLQLRQSCHNILDICNTVIFGYFFSQGCSTVGLPPSGPDWDPCAAQSTPK